MRLGGKSIGPFYFDPRRADRLKYYAFSTRRRIQEIVEAALDAYISADTEEAADIDTKLDRQYGDGNVTIRNTKDLRVEDGIHFSCEDAFEDCKTPEEFAAKAAEIRARTAEGAAQ